MSRDSQSDLCVFELNLPLLSLCASNAFFPSGDYYPLPQECTPKPNIRMRELLPSLPVGSTYRRHLVRPCFTQLAANREELLRGLSYP